MINYSDTCLTKREGANFPRDAGQPIQSERLKQTHMTHVVLFSGKIQIRWDNILYIGIANTYLDVN
jgi:hypothetical protein